MLSKMPVRTFAHIIDKEYSELDSNELGELEKTQEIDRRKVKWACYKEDVENNQQFKNALALFTRRLMIVVLNIVLICIIIVYFVSVAQLFGYFSKVPINGWPLIRETIILFVGTIIGHFVPKGIAASKQENKN